MAIKSLTTVKATIQMRHGMEKDFDADQMTAGEWAVSTDKKYVRMCFGPGVVVRMATYEAFEQDMAEIQIILATCQNIQTAVDAMEKLAKQHKDAAAASANKAKTSETNAKESETAAKTSQTAAKSSETNAKTSETNALASKNAAATSASTASAKASEAATSATNAEKSKNAAATSAANAANSANSASASANTATQKATAASTSASNAENYFKMSKSWAIGEGGMRSDESTNNSKYFAEQAAKVVEAAGSGGLIPMGTIVFENLPTSGMKKGWMYNISNDFTSDSRFEDGGNLYYKAGANVYYTAGGKWDVLTGVQVTGVKGNSETSYRTGNVNITKSNIGLGNVPNVSTNNQTPTFTQAETRANIASGEKLSIILGKIMKVIADLSNTAFDGLATKWRTARKINGMTVDGSADRVNYGTCSTAAATAAKTVSCTGFGLITGAEIVVRFTVTNTAVNPTLNVNSTGAKPIYYRGAAITASYLAANRTYIFRYNGTQYDLVGDINTNTTYSNFVKSGSGAKAGLVPAPSTTAGTSKYLREDGTWATPPDTNTTYGAATQSAAGLMSAADKKKMDGIATGANKTTITNNLLATVAGTALDATQGKALKDDVDALNSKLVESVLLVIKIQTKSSNEVPLGHYNYTPITDCSNYPSRKTIIGTTIESITNQNQVTDVGIGAVRDNYVYICTFREAIYTVMVRVYYLAG